MNQYEYRVVAAPRKPKKVKGAKTSQDRFARTLTDVINEEARMGWEFVSSETLPADEKTSMLGSVKETFHTVLVFRRYVATAQTHAPKPRLAAAPQEDIRREPSLQSEDKPLFSPKIGPAGTRD
jgi:Domain of unknown function (DUF4177)